MFRSIKSPISDDADKQYKQFSNVRTGVEPEGSATIFLKGEQYRLSLPSSRISANECTWNKAVII